jgi:tetratricopeptide (TPR) repeat protein
MGRLSAYFFTRFRTWERPAQIAMLIALGLLALAIIVLFLVSQDTRTPLLIGIPGLLIAIQVIFMWANRSMVTPYTQAQRHYLAGAMDTARQLLEEIDQAGKSDAQTLTLLGNTYRQLGLLDKSAQVLTKAVQIRPLDYFPRYGFGRTLLVMGSYAEAITAIQEALAAGAPPVVRVDLAEAYFRLGGWEEAAAQLHELDITRLEPYRALLIIFMRYRLGNGDAPPANLVRDGLPYWQENAARFHITPYGQALAADVAEMQTFLEE